MWPTRTGVVRASVLVAAGWSSGLALVAGLLMPAEPAVGLRRGNLPGQDPVHLGADGHLHAVALGQLMRGEGGADAFRHGPGRAEDLFQRPAGAELLAQRPVAAQRAHAGRDQVP